MITILKRVICLFSVFILIISFFVVPVSAFDINDYIEVEQGDIPSVNNDVDLFDNQEDNNSDSEDFLDLNDEYYNEDHLVEEEAEVGDSFDTKAELHTVENPDFPNSDTNTENSTSANTNISSNSVSSQANSNENQIQSYSLRSNAAVQSDDDSIMLLSDDDYDIYSILSEHPIQDANNWITGFGDTGSVPISTYYDCGVISLFGFVHNYVLDYYNFPYGDYDDITDRISLSSNNFIIFKYQDVNGRFRYAFSWSDCDLYFVNGFIDLECVSNFVLYENICYYAPNNVFKYYSVSHISMKLEGFDYSGSVSGLSTLHDAILNDSFSIIYSGGHDVYINNVKQDSLNEDGFINCDIKGQFNLNEKSKILSYKAYAEKELDKTYNVHLWALDNSDVPAKITGNEKFPIVDLYNYTGNNLQLSPDKTSGQASIELEAVYYYVHQMKAYDDSLESVDGYNFTEFESRENINFAIAFRQAGSSGSWTVLKSYHYNYGDLIENVMGSFTVKKDYVDFPNIHDYIEGFESWDDVAADCADENGKYNVIEVGLKWIGRNVIHFANNFIGFFKWIFACIPVVWENLTIALYNLVCDLKSLVIYLFNPKSQSIMAMAEERLPGLTQFSNVIQNKSTANLPSFTFFGTKFTLDLSQYDLPWSYLKSFSQILIMILFAVGTYNLVAHVFGFVKLSGIFDNSTDSDEFEDS